MSLDTPEIYAGDPRPYIFCVDCGKIGEGETHKAYCRYNPSQPACRILPPLFASAHPSDITPTGDCTAFPQDVPTSHLPETSDSPTRWPAWKRNWCDLLSPGVVPPDYKLSLNITEPEEYRHSE